MPGLPLVDGLTQTAEEPIHLRLAEFLSQRPGGSSESVAEAIGNLERAFRREGDERVRTKIASALTLLRDGDEYDKKERDK